MATLKIAQTDTGLRVFDSVNIEGFEQSNQLTMSLVGSDLIITELNGTSDFIQAGAPAGVVRSLDFKSVTIPVSLIGSGSLAFDLGLGNDSLEVNMDASFGFTIQFNGESTLPAGSNALVLTSGNSRSSVVHTIASTTSGSVSPFGSGLISYSNTQAVSDLLPVATRTFNFSSVAETVSIADGTAGDGRTVVSSTAGVPVTFVTPSALLLINGGDGDDAVNVASVDASLKASLSVNGGNGTDSISINGPLNLGTSTAMSELGLASETVTIAAAVSTDSTFDGAINLSANAISIAAAVASGTAQTTITTNSSGQQIRLAGADSTGILGISNTELGNITSTADLRIGDDTSGTISVSGVFSRTTGGLSLRSGGSVTANANGSLRVAGSAGIAVRAATGISLNNTTGHEASRIALISAGGPIAYKERAAGGSVIIGTVDGATGIFSPISRSRWSLQVETCHSKTLLRRLTSTRGLRISVSQLRIQRPLPL